MSLGNRALVLLITLAVLFFGVFAATSAKRELFPEMDLPMVMVSANYEGATPQVVESQVTETVEQAVQGVEGVESVTSTSSTGNAQIMAEFDYDQEQDAVVRETQVAVDQMAGMLPEDVEPQVVSMSMDMMPAMMMAIGTSEGDEAELVSTVENVLIPDLESVPGVRSASLSGTAEERVEIDLDDGELEDAGLSSQDVTDALETNGLVQAGGTVNEGERTLSVTTGEEFTSLSQIEDVWVQPSQGMEGPGGTPGAPPEPVQLGELAEVSLEEEDTRTIARLDGEPSIALMIMATPDGNTVEISEGVNDVLDEQSDLLGDDVNVGVVFDQAPFINDSVSDMLEAGGYALVAAVIVILAFLLSIRSTLVVAVSIPTSVLAAFIGMAGFGFTLNMLTLAAITISIGRVVDDSIVVLENIRRHLSYGKERAAAVKDGVGEVATAVASSSLATIAVFLPMAFVGGMVGEIFMPFAVTSALALGGSLLVALTITPVLCYWFLRPREVGERTQAEIEAEQSESEKRTPLQRAYVPVIRWITTKRRSATALTLAASVVIMIGTVAMATTAETDWLGEAEENNYFVVQELEPGTSLEAASEEAEQVEEILGGKAWVDTFQTNIGGDPMTGGGGGGGGVDQIDYTITADPESDQIRNRDVLREEFERMDTENEPRLDATGGMGGSDLQVQVTADNQETLAEATGLVEDAMRDIEGAEDVTSDLSETQSSLEVHVDGEEAAEHGLDEAMIGQMLSSAFNGRTVGNATLDEVRHDTVVLADEAPQTRGELEDFELTSPTGEDLVLTDVAEVEEVEQPPELTRIDGVTSTTVSGSATASDLGAVTQEMTRTLDGLDLPSGASVSIGGVSQDQTEGFAQLGLALLAAIVISYLIMVATFKSLIQPLIMLVSVPFAATGSLGLLLLTGTPLGAAALIGMLMLIGIVITNAIVLMDLINQKRKQGMEMSEAIVEGTRHRLRPILMTAAGTMVALVPLATGIAGGGMFISGPVAIVVIGGLFTSTVGTLVLVPVLYQLVEWRRSKREAKWAARYERKRRRRAEKAARAD
ncbi:hydrogenase expression protein [Nocardiopsis kunsanensis]|uniref:Hydrogenase expression protein n=2 Tax=Nocardiopsis kunsanensis TaxID=141693 RepID=A0A918XBA5_9ACTN|nr:hydrogenase expression protein [Nocardiopsis kunsanensis]